MEHFTEPLPVMPQAIAEDAFDVFMETDTPPNYFEGHSYFELAEAYYYAQQDAQVGIGEPEWFAQTQEMSDIISELRNRGIDEGEFFTIVDNWYED